MANKKPKTITVPAYQLKQLGTGSYVVVDGEGNDLTQEYPHQTSAYAALGRLVAKESEKLEAEEK